MEAHFAERLRRDEEWLRDRRDEREDQRRRDEVAGAERRDLAACVRALLARVEKFEPVLLGDAALGQKSLGERLETVERALLSARIGWRTATVIGTGLLSLASALAYLAHRAPLWLGGPWRE